MLFSLAALLSASSVKLAPIFCDGFVLQDFFMFDSRSFIFGTASPGEHVRLLLSHDANTSIATQYESVADARTGKWIAQIDPDYFNVDPATGGQVANVGSRTLTLAVTGSADGFKSRQIVKGVRFGDVFVCAGGQEMARPLSASSDGQALLKAAPKNVRIFTGSAWQSAADSAQALQQFSAACVFTAVSLPKLSRIYAKNRTVALILAASPAAPIKSWLPTGASFGALLRPFARYALRAVVWSHGAEELSAPSFNATEYGSVLGAVIAGVRVAWEQGDVAWISAQTSAVTNSSAPAAAELRLAQDTILPRRGGTTALTGVVCTADLGDLSSSTIKSSAGSDLALGKRLAAQVLHVQWGWAQNMSTSPAAVAAGLQSIDWRALSTCRNSSSSSFSMPRPQPAEPPSVPLPLPVPLLGSEAKRLQGAEEGQAHAIAATPPMGW